MRERSPWLPVRDQALVAPSPACWTSAARRCIALISMAKPQARFYNLLGQAQLRQNQDAGGPRVRGDRRQMIQQWLRTEETNGG